MAWIKRNLFFFIGGVVAIAMLGAAGYYNYTSWSRNSDQLDKLKELYGTLSALNDPQSNPGKDNGKTQKAKDETKQLNDWIDQAKAWFAPIPPIPPSSTSDPVTSETFAAALRRTIDVMQHEAEAANVQIPPDYGFSFEAERSLVKFSNGSLGPLAVQLGEVKTISEILFSAGVNELDTIQRVRASDDDANGPQGDYIGDQPITGDQAVLTPYVINFQSFGPEIARIFAGFAASPHCFIIKSINVLPTNGSSNQGGPMNMGGPHMGRGRGMFIPPTQNQEVVPTDKSGLTTVLKEQLLRVSLEVEIVKLQPKN